MPRNPEVSVQQTERPDGFQEVLAKELGDIVEARRGRGLPEDTPPGKIGLAFSGGGIRSATFNLGILQGLAKKGSLAHFDYLSTVSGGGYIGSWLAAWIKRRGFGEVNTALADVAGKVPVRFLRSFSNYLAPKTGFFSADTWTIATVWVLNTALVQSVLILFLCAALLAPRILKALLVVACSFPALAMALASCAAIAFAAFEIGANLKTFECGPSDADRTRARPREWRFTQPGVQWRVVLPLFVACWLLSASLAAVTWKSGAADLRWLWGSGSGFAALLALCGWKSGYIRCFDSPGGRSRWRAGAGLAVISLVCGAAGGLLVWGAAHLYVYWGQDPDTRLWNATVWGVPVLLQILTAVVVMQIGAMGRGMPDDWREWWSRLGAWISLYAMAALLVAVIGVYGPQAVAKLAVWAPKTVTAGWILSTAISVLLGKSARTGGKPGDEKPATSPLEFVTAVGPYAFILGLLLVLSTGLHLGLSRAACESSSLASPGATIVAGSGEDPARKLDKLEFQVSTEGKQDVVKGKLGVEGTLFAACCGQPPHRTPLCDLWKAGLPAATLLDRNHWVILNAPRSRLVLAAMLALLFLTGLTAWRIDINKFSMHHFYRNRLVRCYLGASNSARSPNPFTGFDWRDDFLLSRFVPRDEAEPDKPYYGPYPVINATLNFSDGEQLAFQERKGASFVFTPRYCGYPGRDCYRPTAEYACPVPVQRRPGPNLSGIHLGTAVAVSGAAASPNSGYHTSMPIAFLLTLFNVRLGSWLGNPCKPGAWRLPSPKFGLGYLLFELFGSAGLHSRFVYLSDGGHFENLGIYELVRRRCRLIVACDAEEDAEFRFDGLGSAVRKCRTDLGTEIVLDNSRLRDRDPKTGQSKQHFAIGEIRYPDGDWGVLLYIKSSLAEDDEPQDVIAYRKRASAFPHQSTGDQFFDESQFESYRALGKHVLLRVWEQLGITAESWSDREKLFVELRMRSTSLSS